MVTMLLLEQNRTEQDIYFNLSIYIYSSSCKQNVSTILSAFHFHFAVFAYIEETRKKIKQIHRQFCNTFTFYINLKTSTILAYVLFVLMSSIYQLRCKWYLQVPSSWKSHHSHPLCSMMQHTTWPTSGF